MKKITGIVTLVTLSTIGLVGCASEKEASSEGHKIEYKKDSPSKDYNQILTSAKKNRSDKMAKFFEAQVLPINISATAVARPNNVKDYLAEVGLSIQGVVTDMQSQVGKDDLPYTLVSVYVNKILKGDPKIVGTTIKVIHPGGLIKKSTMLSSTQEKDFISDEEKAAAKSDELMLVNYPSSPLPRVGDDLAMFLSPFPEGEESVLRNGETYYGYEGTPNQALFIKENKSNLYQRSAEIEGIPGNEIPGIEEESLPSKDEEDIKMAKELTDLINKS